MGDAQKRGSLIKVLGELIGHCGLDLTLPRSRLLDDVVGVRVNATSGLPVRTKPLARRTLPRG